MDSGFDRVPLLLIFPLFLFKFLFKKMHVAEQRISAHFYRQCGFVLKFKITLF